jgi:hypothetical protein
VQAKFVIQNRSAPNQVEATLRSARALRFIAQTMTLPHLSTLLSPSGLVQKAEAKATNVSVQGTGIRDFRRSTSLTCL